MIFMICHLLIVHVDGFVVYQKTLQMLSRRMKTVFSAWRTYQLRKSFPAPLCSLSAIAPDDISPDVFTAVIQLISCPSSCYLLPMPCRMMLESPRFFLSSVQTISFSFPSLVQAVGVFVFFSSSECKMTRFV